MIPRSAHVFSVSFCYDSDWFSSPEFCMVNTIGGGGGGGGVVAQWLRCCTTNRSVAGSILDSVTGIFH